MGAVPSTAPVRYLAGTHAAETRRPLVVRESPGSPAPKPKLLDRVRDAIRARHYSRRTEKAYVHWIRRYILFHRKRHPAEMGAPEVRAFLTALAVEHRVSASTQNQALSALLFLYRAVLGVDLPWLDGVVRAKRLQPLPVVLTRHEVYAVLRELSGVSRLMAVLLYGSGLRLLECCRLRVKDVDFATNQIVVRDGKGRKDRVSMLPVSIKEALTAHLERVRQQHQADLRQGAGWVELPGALGRKYPHAGREWGWQWVVPATRLYVDRVTGQRRRHHLHESVLQRAVKAAVQRAGIPKPATCHTFRHSFATHLIAGTPRRQHHDDLHPRPQPRAGRRQEPRRPPGLAMNRPPGRYQRRPERDLPRRLAAYPGPGAFACPETLWRSATLSDRRPGAAWIDGPGLSCGRVQDR